MTKTTYVDPKTLGLPAGTADQAWLAAQVERIDPWHMEQGSDGGNTRALEKLALELRDKLSAPTEQQAQDMGAKGAEPTEAERHLFEAWMRGHCWAVSGTWDGKTYVHETEKGGNHLHNQTMFTRGLWAAWRDRAALSVGGAAA